MVDRWIDTKKYWLCRCTYIEIAMPSENLVRIIKSARQQRRKKEIE